MSRFLKVPDPLNTRYRIQAGLLILLSFSGLGLLYSAVDLFFTDLPAPLVEDRNRDVWLEVDEQDCDLGTVLSGHHVSAEVRITNTTSRQLRVVRIVPGCGCLSVVPRTTDLGPGESTFIDGRLKAKNRLGSMGVGIKIELEDELGQRLRQLVLLTANISPTGGIACFPEIINFGTVTKGERPRRVAELTITSEKADDETELELISVPEGVVADLENCGRTSKLVVVLDPSRSEVFGADMIRIRDTKTQNLWLDIPLSWRVKALTRALPAAVVVNAPPDDTNGTSTVKLVGGEDIVCRVVHLRIHDSGRKSDVTVNATIQDNSTILVGWSRQSQKASSFSGIIEADVSRSQDGTERKDVVRIPLVIKCRPGASAD